MARNLVLIAGTAYAGEIKKSGVLAVQLPRAAAGRAAHALLGQYRARRATPRCSSASRAPARRRCRNDPERPLIGDDEHGWTDRWRLQPRGRLLRQDGQAQRHRRARDLRRHAAASAPCSRTSCSTTTQRPLYDDISLTENTRAAYPLETLPRRAPRAASAASRRTVVFLTADAFGVLPPIARLTPEQAVYHFLSGYTAKVAGTERGVTEPSATFSACFGAPVHVAASHASMASCSTSGSPAAAPRVWLLNTGWTGGAYGVGKRIDIASTRRLLTAALSGELADDADADRSAVRLRRAARRAGRRPRRCSIRAPTGPTPRPTTPPPHKLLHLFEKNFRKFDKERRPPPIAARTATQSRPPGQPGGRCVCPHAAEPSRSGAAREPASVQIRALGTRSATARSRLLALVEGILTAACGDCAQNSFRRDAAALRSIPCARSTGRWHRKRDGGGRTELECMWPPPSVSFADASPPRGGRAPLRRRVPRATREPACAGPVASRARPSASLRVEHVRADGGDAAEFVRPVRATAWCGRTAPNSGGRPGARPAGTRRRRLGHLHRAVPGAAFPCRCPSGRRRRR